MDVTLCTPLPRSWWPDLWAWLQEDPHANFDDTGPQTYEAFIADMNARDGIEQTWGVMADDVPCGAIAIRLLTPRLAQTHGVVFTQAVHGLGVARSALMQVLQSLSEQGIEKVSAAYFADNTKIRHCLSALGAVDEGLLKAHTVRAGVPIDMQMVAIFAGK